MDYKNFILRLLFSTIFISVYFICSYLNMKYIFYLIILIYFLILLEVFIYFKKYRIIPIIYIFISFIFFLRIDFSNQFFLNFNLFILTVIIFDVFSYIIGKSYGKIQLIKISPNKTYEGFLGGFLFSYLVSLLFSYFYHIAINLELIFFIFFINLSAFIGDIIESYYKRKNNLKNSSEFIPGHGGVFDRFDSFLFAIIIYSISINFLV